MWIFNEKKLQKKLAHPPKMFALENVFTKKIGGNNVGQCWKKSK